MIVLAKVQIINSLAQYRIDVVPEPTILDNINGTSGPPLPPISMMPKGRVFCSFPSSSFAFGRKGLIVPFYSVQD